MDSVNVNKCEEIISIGAKDRGNEQETLYILQNTNLMNQIAESARTHANNKGYEPNKEDLGEIIGV